jgi:hypothetical protein
MGQRIVETPFRYVPKAIGSGHRWGVWDRQEERFIPDLELLRMSVDDLANATITQ